MNGHAATTQELSAHVGELQRANERLAAHAADLEQVARLYEELNQALEARIARVRRRTAMRGAVPRL